MESLAPQPFDIFEVFSRYSDIMSNSQPSGGKTRLAAFSKSLESRGQSGSTIFDEIGKLMSSLDLSGNSHQFNLIYDFVFFICRGDGQKNLTVNRAIAGWRLVLSGRFRLLCQWCNFVEMHQRNSISEDTWQQLLAFSQCVNEDLEGYDPNGAWPILIDNFVQHMYRINKSSGQHGSTEDFTSADADRQSGISESFSRLNLHSGSRRKSKYLEVSTRSDYNYLVRPKRIKHTSFTGNLGLLDSGLSVGMSNGTLDNQDGTSKCWSNLVTLGFDVWAKV
ncbi:defective in cullin neddylation protein AAR3-like isoform X2 [Zingiber officinale]|uniref:defective in cullin neddylation protein AAR3-like isoform X2 n=2 Tax=Zingiber officinale TaxID=94328 RepID=UPI001C4DBF9C|nr:defective in cullin neddylation protein AAR3-like isoform X2 [Zingiber officinale]